MSEPDLSKIVNLIMQNPELIEQIKRLGENNEAPAAENLSTNETTTVPTPVEKEISTSAQIKDEGKARRRELLSALKPYLSKERSRAIDSMMSIAEVLEVMRSK